MLVPPPNASRASIVSVVRADWVNTGCQCAGVSRPLSHTVLVNVNAP